MHIRTLKTLCCIVAGGLLLAPLTAAAGEELVVATADQDESEPDEGLSFDLDDLEADEADEADADDGTWAETPAETAEAGTSGSSAHERAEGAAEEPPADPLHWGWIVASVGGGVAAIGGIGMLSLESVIAFTNVGSGEDREGMQLGERILFGATAVALIGGLVGTMAALSDGYEVD